MRAVLHRDHVKVRVVRHDKRGRPEGRVVEIVQRPPHPIIGRLLHEGGIWLVAPEDKRYGQDVLIPKQGIGEAKAGEVVVVELTEPPALYGQPIGRVREVLGDIDDAGMEIEIAVRKYGVPHEFSAAAIAEARALPDTVQPADKAGRVDLTDVPLCTIDGEDARDFDDAVYCEPAVVTGRGKKPNGWRLLVAIADVSHYVKTNSPIDVDAYDRATSVYFPRRVIPMLPEKLSNGLCSLNPDVDRLCMVCDMLVTANGDVHAYQFYPAVMHSHARFTYTEVAAILANTRGPEAAKRKARVKDLENLHDVFRALLKARHARGAVDFDTVETQIIADESGRIERIEPRTRNDAHRLIEECMLAANVSSADYILGSKHAGLFRVHEGPTPEKMELLRAYLKALGLGLSISDEPHPSEFQRIAEATKDRPDAEQIHMMLLRSMSQAIYTPTNSGHFGLGYEAYTHFTSPIRRYPDLLVHRVIKAILQDRKYQLPDLPTPGEAHEKLSRRLKKQSASRRRDEGAPPKRLSDELLGWEAAGLHCSANERRAEEASRDVESWLKCKYMKEHLGEVFNGTVTAVTTFGLFVTLNDLHVEGLVHITELGGEYFRFDEVRQELRGERTGIRYIIGSKVRVQVSRVDLDGRKIDFRMVSENDELPARPPRDRAGSAAAEGRAGNTAKPAKSAKSAKAGGRAARPPRADGEGPSRQAMSPIQALKASLKKATGRAKKSSKPRKTRR